MDAIIGAGPEPIDSLNPYHRNPRKGDVGAIAAAIKEFGQYKPIVVNRGTKTGRPREILAGNHTHQAAKSLGLETIDVVWVDEDEDQAAKIVLIDNRAGDLSTYDNDVLFSLLEGLQNLAGVGYTEDDYQTILTDLAPREPLVPKQAGKTQEGVNTFDRKAEYDGSPTRGILIDYSIDDHEAVTEQLTALRKAWGFKDNAAVVIQLLEDATGETAPEGTE